MKTTPNPNNTLLAKSFFNIPLFENDNKAIDIENTNLHCVNLCDIYIILFLFLPIIIITNI